MSAAQKVRSSIGAALVAAGALLWGCTPKVDVNVGLDRPGPLREAEVFADPGAGSDKVAMIDVRGVLADARRPGLLGAGPNPVDQFIAALEKAKADPNVRAVVIRINSPGGTVTASDVMHEELRRFTRETKKPAVASIGEVGASGGYYLALGADRIVAQPTSITGSIGVIIPTVNVHEGLASIGIHSRAITSGPNKAMGDPLGPRNETHYALLQEMVDDFYSRFKGLVVSRRPGVQASDLAPATDGRVVTGRRAAELGLVDAEGGVRESFEEAKRLAGVRLARLVKYTESARPVRSAYAEGSVNLVNVDLASLLGPAGLEPGNAYYIWAPGLE